MCKGQCIIFFMLFTCLPTSLSVCSLFAVQQSFFLDLEPQLGENTHSFLFVLSPSFCCVILTELDAASCSSSTLAATSTAASNGTLPRGASVLLWYVEVSPTNLQIYQTLSLWGLGIELVHKTQSEQDLFIYLFILQALISRKVGTFPKHLLESL